MSRNTLVQAALPGASMFPYIPESHKYETDRTKEK